ncbi:MAG: amidase [Pseudomonadota bacterium]|nr:amidase [Pseudomonadota bacterium]
MQEGIEYASVSEVAALIRSGDVLSFELTQLMLDRIEKMNSLLNAFITVTAESALKQAVKADSELADGRDRGPLHGIPVAIKDLIDTQGVLTTGGSKHYENRVPESDATVVARLREAGAVMLGKTGLHEMAFGSTSINPFFGAVSNPWKLDHHPGGSSGGSAVAVAAGLAYAALGTDTGCSVRQPAQCCGIVGHKPTFGLVSKAGVLPVVSSMDHVGPITRCVRDAALVLQAIVGADHGDPLTLSVSVNDFLESLEDSIDDAVIGVPRDYFFEGGDCEIVDIVDKSLQVFSDLGAHLQEVKFPDCALAYEAADATFSEIVDANGDVLKEDPEGFSDEFRQRYRSVEQYRGKAYEAAQIYRREFKNEVENVMRHCDVLATPTSTVVAAPVQSQPPDHAKERRKNCCIFNFTGQPSISIPCGFTQAGLPVGLMLTGGALKDSTVLRFARAFERATPWHRRHPPEAIKQ